MKQGLFTIIENEQLTKSVWQMRLAGDTSAIIAPGQFVNILLDGKFLRRPISVCDCEGDELTLIYRGAYRLRAQRAQLPPLQRRSAYLRRR